MAQANAAREPSMEEILASIRKIIESNDTAEDPGGQAEAAETPVEERPSTVVTEQPISLLNRLAESDRETEADAQEAAPVQPDAGVGPVEQRFASFHATPLRTGEPLRTGDKADADKSSIEGEERGMSEMMRSEDGDRDGPSPLTEIEPAGTAADREPGERLTSKVREVVALSATNEPEASVSDEADVELPTEPIADSDVGATLQDEEARALVSPAAGARVAASFDNLNHAVSHGPTRSFDQIAEDMLRPMLQEWLDDNLPTLVERLVREEIERIARGQ